MTGLGSRLTYRISICLYIMLYHSIFTSLSPSLSLCLSVSMCLSSSILSYLIWSDLTYLCIYSTPYLCTKHTYTYVPYRHALEKMQLHMSQWTVLIVWQFRPTSRPGSSRSMLKRQKRHLVPWTAVRGDVDIEWYRYTAVPSYPVAFALVRIVGEVWYSCTARNDDWHRTFGSWIIPEKYKVGPWTHGISHGTCVLVVGLQKSYIINIYIHT